MIDPRRLASLVLLLLASHARAAEVASEVTLPLERYEELRRLARPAEATPREVGAPIVLEACALAIEVGATSARVVESWTVTLFGDGWLSLALPGDRAVVESSFGAFEGALAGGAERALLLRGGGRSTIRLVSIVPLVVDQDATRLVERFALELPGAAAVAGELILPPTIDSVEPGGELAVWKTGERWHFAGRPGSRVELTLAGPSPQVERSDVPLRFTTRVASLLSPTRARFAMTSWVAATVIAGRLDELRLDLPAGLEVVDANGPLAAWRVERRELVLVPLASVENELAVEVELAGAPVASWQAPRLAAMGSERESQLVRAVAENDALLRVVDFGGARLAEIADGAALPPGFLAAKGPILAVDPGAERPSWELVWPDGAELLSAQVDRLLYEVAAGANGRAFVRAWFVVRSSGLDRIAIEMPAGFELAEAERDGEPFSPGGEGGALVAPLTTGSAAQIVCLSGFVPLELSRQSERLELALPATSVPIGRVEVRLVVPGNRRFQVADRAREGSAAAPPVLAVSAPGSAAPPPLWAPVKSRTARSAFELPRPTGFVESTAAWSALTPRPAALLWIRDNEKEELPWF